MFCGKCGNEIPEGGSFCVKCGARTDGAASVQQTSAAAVPVAPAANNKNKNIIIAVAAIAVVILIVVLFKSLSSPTSFKGNENNPDALIKVANNYLSSDEWKFADKGWVYNFEAINYAGKLGDYYQFHIVGTEYNKETGEEYEYTEDDTLGEVLTETENGIERIPLSKWLYSSEITDSDYKSNQLNVIVYKAYYDYETGNLIAEARLHNGYANDVKLTELELKILDKDKNIIAERKIDLNDKLSNNYYIDKTIVFDNGCTYKFIDDLSGITFDYSITGKT